MFEYPFDGAAMLRKKKSLASQLRQKPGLLPTRIAILGGSTTNHVADLLELFLLDCGIAPVLYQCEYGQFYEEALYNSTQLAAFAPDFVYLHTGVHNITDWPAMSDSDSACETLLQAQYNRFAQVWQALEQKLGCTILQNNFELPQWRLQGNRDASDRRGRVNFVNRLNGLFADYAAAHRSFFLNDICYLSAQVGLSVWHDPIAWHAYKYAPAPAAIPALCQSVARLVRSVLGKSKKALVLDLDNTLWGGVVGDDGVEGIEIGTETPTGQLYREFQQYLRAQRDMGVLLTINSKNNHENALAGLNHPASQLRPQDFLVIKANWENKDKNIAEIAHELTILPDSLVFVDDNPVERGIVAAMDAGVAVPAIGQPEDYIRVLDQNGYFEVTNFSQDDLHRNDMYRDNLQRTQLAQAAGSYEDYLRSLCMTAQIGSFVPVYLPRIAQLTNKSNQFNLTTLRCTTADMERAAADSCCVTLYGSLQDRFGDNGVVSVVLGQLGGDTLDITLWLMSCRVLKRGMEDAMLDMLVAAAAAKGAARLRGHYYPTAKNSMVSDFFTTMGFSLLSRDADGTGLWELPVAGYQKRNSIITINGNGKEPNSHE